MVDVGVGSWVAFSRGERARLVGQIVRVFGTAESPEVRVWCSELLDVVPVAPGEIIEEVPYSHPVARRASADGS